MAVYRPTGDLLNFFVLKLTYFNFFRLSVHYLRHLKDFFQSTFKLELYKDGDEDDKERLKMGDSDRILLTCVGVGYSNINKMIL